MLESRGEGKIVIRLINNINKMMKMSLHAGIGTHMDAPSHCISGGKSIHELEVNDLCMPFIVINVSSKAHERYRSKIAHSLKGRINDDFQTIKPVP